MPAYFTQGFMVREPAWHRLGTVLEDYPGREEAMELAGHDYEVIEIPIRVDDERLESLDPELWKIFLGQPVPSWKALIHSKTGTILNIVKDSYTVIQNEVGWDVIDALVGEGARYETGITLKDGAVCVVTVLLDEPVKISGDDSLTLPYGVARWAHDGSASLTCRSTSVRVVCSNTDEASAMQAKKLGTDFTFKHTKNVMEKIEDAKMAIRAIRTGHEAYVRLSEELAKKKVSKEQRELFITEFLPMPPEALISDRVVGNVEEARALVRNLFEGPTIPEAHKLTAYGLRLAGIEYLDHLRGYHNNDTYVGRQLLRTEPAKKQLGKLIAEVIKS